MLNEIGERSAKFTPLRLARWTVLRNASCARCVWMFALALFVFTVFASRAVALPLLSINNVSVNEGKAGIVTADFAVTLSSPSTEIVTVTYATADGTATAASGDYQQILSSVITFAPEELSR